MSDTKQRFNRLVTLALETSPHARKVHDQYYTKEHSYRYQMAKNLEQEAALIFDVFNPGKDMAVMLGMNRSDDRIPPMVHHELVHVQQLKHVEKLGFPLFAYGYPKELISFHLLSEAHAFTVQMEGVCFGLFNDLKNGKMKNLEFYQRYLQPERIGQYAAPYLSGLLDKEIDCNANICDVASMGFLREFQFLDEKEQAAQKTKARQESIRNFFSVNKKDVWERTPFGNIYRNNQVLDAYVESGMTMYQKASDTWTNNVPAAIQNMKRLFPPYGLKEIANVLNDEDEVFLTVDQLSEALGADTVPGLFAKVMRYSDHSTKAIGLGYHQS